MQNKGQAGKGVVPPLARKRKGVFVSKIPFIGERVFTERRTHHFTAAEKEILIPVYRRIRKKLAQNVMVFVSGGKVNETVEIGGRQALITSARPNEYRGTQNFGALKVAFGGRESFLKIHTKPARETILGVGLINAFLKSHGNKFGEYSVRVIPIEGVHEFMVKGRFFTLYATPFFPEHEVTMVMGITDTAVKGQVMQVMEKVTRGLAEQYHNHLFDGIAAANSFYGAREKTIYLYDLTGYRATRSGAKKE